MRRQGGGDEGPLAQRERSRAALYREVVNAAVLGLAVNTGLGLAKLAGGLVGHSFALVSDAVNSLGDVVTSLVVLFALRLAQRPPDPEHPYGHTRAEAIAGLSVSLLVLGSALLVGAEAIRRLPLAHEVSPGWTLWIAGANVVIKEVLFRYKIRIGQRTGSRALMAHAWDHRADAFSALAVLVGLAMVRWGGPRYLFADELAALVVVAIILRSAFSLVWDSAHELMDAQAEGAFVSRIEAEALADPDVLGVETLWVRKSGLEFFADLHLEIDPGLTIAEGHRIGHRVKDRLLRAFPTLRDVLVHLEPSPHFPDHAPAE
ncbi:cation diffusion facilitator family transporter [Tautonia plasticadhaerens]|uniref:Putative cation efflux system protein n=1 Tax=Tautonia plasticadhaerens TaxID=2527974 RepID=A0A518HCU6_9BACT|nr:cation diffusion facilitator family transporter [Tautonia plasticadhaerens]QDV38486.1 putative cation efflux system protein [Tautonia plasticadhaerens]